MDPRRAATVSLTLVGLLAAWGARAGAAGVNLRVEPHDVSIGIMFHGAEVRVGATVPRDLPIAVVCLGEEGTVELKVKGKVAGLLWLNVGDATFSSAPSVFLVSTTEDLGECNGTLTSTGVPLGYSALEAKIGLAPTNLPKHRLFLDFLKLKQKEELYAIRPGSAVVKAHADGSLRLSATLTLPARIPPGHYEIFVFACCNGVGELLGSSSFSVTRAGLVRSISDLAQHQALVYGLLAVVVAIGAGILTGMLFGFRSKGGH